MNEPKDRAAEPEDAKARPLVEGDDYYLEGGLMVFTGKFLTRRGYCCESGCRHCPYGFNEEVDISPDEHGFTQIQPDSKGNC